MCFFASHERPAYVQTPLRGEDSRVPSGRLKVGRCFSACHSEERGYVLSQVVNGLLTPKRRYAAKILASHRDA
jgi:hypothetical protein